MYKSEVKILGVKNNKSMQNSNQLKTFARMESDCTLRLGLSLSIKNSSYTTQLNLLLHFFKTLKFFSRSFVVKQCFSRKCFAIAEDEFLCFSTR